MSEIIQAQPDTQANSEPVFNGVFLQIPLSVHQKLLTSSSKQPQAYALFMEVLRRIGSNQTARFRQDKLAEALGVSLRTVQGTLSWLEAEGYLASRRTGKAKYYARGTLLIAYSEAEKATAQDRKQAKAASRYATDCVSDTQPIAQGTKENNSLSKTNKQPDIQPAQASSPTVFVEELVKELNSKLPASQPQLKPASLKQEQREAFNSLKDTLTATEAAAGLLELALKAKAQRVASWLNSSAGTAAAEELLTGKATSTAQREKEKQQLERDRAAQRQAELEAQATRESKEGQAAIEEFLAAKNKLKAPAA